MLNRSSEIPMHSFPTSSDTSNKPLVELDYVALQKLQILLPKGPRPVVFLLSLNVLANRLDLRVAHGENTVSVLPRKPAHPAGLVNPFGGFPFHIPHHLGQLM